MVTSPQSDGLAELRHFLAQTQNSFGRHFDKVSRVRPVLTTEIPRDVREEPVRIALLSLGGFGPSPRTRAFSAVPTQPRPRKCPENAPRAHERCLIARTASEAKRHDRQFRRGLEEAFAEPGTRIVCVNELGFPARDAEPIPETIKFCHKIAHKHNALIVAGTAHERETLSNAALIFYPGGPPSALRYYKQVSAYRGVRELVSVPPIREVPWMEVYGLRVAILVCFDLMDVSSVAAVVRARDRVDMILVPCYSEPTESLRRIAKTISALIHGCVALANYTRQGEHGGWFYVFGKYLDPDCGYPTVHEEGGSRVRELTAATIDQERINEMRFGVPDPDASNILHSWLFDLPDIREIE